MRTYLAYFSARFRAQLQYRAAALAGIGTQIFFGIVNIMVITAFYRASDAAQPLSAEQAVSYIWLAQALLLVLPFRLDREITHLIRTGNIAYELARPVSLPLAWLARGVADRTAPVLLRMVPQLVFSTLLLRLLGWPEIALGAPTSLAAGLLAGLSAIAGAAVSAAIGLIACATLFWTIAGAGTSVLFSTTIWLLSGVTIPLPLFPDWIQPIIRILPFRAMIDVPFQIYLGTVAGADVVLEIATQLVWAIGLGATASLMIARGMRRVEVQGG
ncbi:MAG: ABC transporter permease [Spirochaetota bacterium]